jgi:hypothetical protein
VENGANTHTKQIDALFSIVSHGHRSTQNALGAGLVVWWTRRAAATVTASDNARFTYGFALNRLVRL